MNRASLMVILFLGILLTSCVLLQEEQVIELDRKSYIIDKSLILQDLEESDQLSFIDRDDSPIGIINPDNLVSWNTDDFFEIMNAFQKFIWSENEDNWKISYISYVWSCSYFENGPQNASITFFRSTSEKRFESNIYLHPTQSYISGVRKMYSPRILDWKAIDFPEINISPDEALTLAEENGGFDFRISTENQCQVSVIYNTALFDGWAVVYSPNQGVDLIFKLNPKTGKFVK